MNLAARGVRELDDGTLVPLDDDPLERALQSRAGRIWAKSIAIALAYGTLLWLFPL